MKPFVNNGSLPIRGVGRLPGPLSDQLWSYLKNAETLAMVLIEGEFPLTWFLTTAFLFKREREVSSVYTWTDDTDEGVYHLPGWALPGRRHDQRCLLGSLIPCLSAVHLALAVTVASECSGQQSACLVASSPLAGS